MGGDGALGFVQAGVLQWLEDNRVPVDYLAGTSMGGFIAGVYASGVSPAEIQLFLRNVIWDQTYFLGEAPYQPKGKWITKNDIAEAEKNGALRGLKLSGLFAYVPQNKGPVMIFPLLPRVVNRYSDLQSFDTLPTAFRCTSVDLISGEVVVMNQGSLPVALSATMALPGLMDPVRIGDKLLVGGGPLPVEVARGGADVVIASYVYSHARLEADTNWLQQIQRSLQAAKAEADRREISQGRGISQADIVIPIDTSEYTTFDLLRVYELIRLGYKSAEAKRDLLVRYAVSQEDWEHYLDERNRRRIR